VVRIECTKEVGEMQFFKREDIRKKMLPGRVIQLLIGKDDAASTSELMTMGFAHYSEETDPMDPHRHAEEIVYVLSAEDGYVRHGGFGEEPTELGNRVPLQEGLTLHVPAGEWHVFEYDEGGHVDIIFFYSQADVYSKS
jgi:hypothetical protein